MTSLVGGHEGGEEAVQAGHVGRQGEDGGAVQATAGNGKTGGMFQVIEQVLTRKSDDPRVLQPSSPDITGRLAQQNYKPNIAFDSVLTNGGRSLPRVGNI